MECCRPIPKIIHIFEENEETSSHQVQVRSLHPDWDVMVWTPNKTVEIINTDIMQHKIDMFQRIDILKFETLSQLGGVWIDKGINLELPLDNFIRNTNHILVESFADKIDARIMGFSPNHRAVWDYLLKIQPRYFEYLDSPQKAFDASWIWELVEKNLSYSMVLPYRCLPFEDDEFSRPLRGFLGTRTRDERYT